VLSPEGRRPPFFRWSSLPSLLNEERTLVSMSAIFFGEKFPCVPAKFLVAGGVFSQYFVGYQALRSFPCRIAGRFLLWTRVCIVNLRRVKATIQLFLPNSDGRASFFPLSSAFSFETSAFFPSGKLCLPVYLLCVKEARAHVPSVVFGPPPLHGIPRNL